MNDPAEKAVRNVEIAATWLREKRISGEDAATIRAAIVRLETAISEAVKA